MRHLVAVRKIKTIFSFFECRVQILARKVQNGLEFSKRDSAADIGRVKTVFCINFLVCERAIFDFGEVFTHPRALSAVVRASYF